ncbi:unnamed protein product, partial [Vitis vinifera]
MHGNPSAPTTLQRDLRSFGLEKLFSLRCFASLLLFCRQKHPQTINLCGFVKAHPSVFQFRKTCTSSMRAATVTVSEGFFQALSFRVCENVGSWYEFKKTEAAKC